MADVQEQRAGAGVGQPARATISDALTRVERTEQRSYLRQSWQRFRKNTLAMVALILTIAILCFGYGAPLIERYVTGNSYYQTNLRAPFKKPLEDGYILGTDNLGRDLLTRLAYGGRISMTVAILAVAVALTIGCTFGALAGYYGRWVDSIIMRFVDMILSIPTLFLLILISTLFTVGAFELAFVIAAVGWMTLARLVRGEIMSLKRRDYIEAARVLGASDRRIILRHMLPNLTPIILVWATLAVPVLIIVEASLSYLGLGVQPPVPSWGNMLSGAQGFIAQSWTLIFLPGFMIYITVLAINVLGNGLRDALDPRLGD